MDDYPEHLAPEFDDGGGVITPFDEWWPRVKEHFSSVPDEVAREWIHRHWGYSPFSYLPSKCYQFQREDWNSSALLEVRSGLNNFGEPTERIEHGRYLVEEHSWRHWLTEYMLSHGTFPTPIICLDNRDGHLETGAGFVPTSALIPKSFFLVEGHLRFDIAQYLLNQGKLNATVPIWVMKKV